MDNDLISRSALLEEIAHGKNKPEIYDGSQEADWMMHCISTAPAVDARIIRHAKWIEQTNPYTGRYFTCSNCGKDENHHTAIKGKFCWYCGVKMDMEDE